MSEELLPCPFCGGKNVNIVPVSIRQPMHFTAICVPSLDGTGCGASDQWTITEHEAVEKWNTRATGCARNQRTTQYCAEAVELANKVAVQAEALRLAEEKASLIDLNFKRSEAGQNFLGDDEHEAWNAAQAILAAIRALKEKDSTEACIRCGQSGSRKLLRGWYCGACIEEAVAFCGKETP